MLALAAQYPEVRDAVADVFEHLRGVRLAVFYVEPLGVVERRGEFGECEGRVARAREREAEFFHAGGLVERFELVHLFEYAPRVFEELLALLGRLDAFGGAAEYRDVHVFLELADGFAQVRLPHEEIFRGPRNGARLRHLDCVAQMLDIVHKFILRSLFRHAPIIAEKVKKCVLDL